MDLYSFYNNGMNEVDEILKFITDAQYLTVFTGAGVSTLSGLRDFRGKDGLYREVDANKIFDLPYFLEDPGFYYSHTLDLIYDTQQIRPSLVHTVLARLQRRGYVKRVITQNIDLLHQKGGSTDVLEIHGSPRTHHCLSCGRVYLYDEIVPIVRFGQVPFCEVCDGLIKPDITFFGESLPQKALQEAYAESSKSDCMLILGSTLLVSPASSLPLRTLQNGGKIIIANRGETPLDSYASLRYDDLFELFSYLEEALDSDLL